MAEPDKTYPIPDSFVTMPVPDSKPSLSSKQRKDFYARDDRENVIDTILGEARS